GENLKVAVRVRGQNLQQLRVHERLAAEDAKKAVADFFGLVDHLVHRRDVDRLLLGGDVDPATLAAEVAAIDDGDVEEGRKKFAALEPALVTLHGAHALKAHVVRQLPYEPLIRFQQHTFRHPQIHRQTRCKEYQEVCEDDSRLRAQRSSSGTRLSRISID